MWGRVEIDNELETKFEDEVECHEFLKTHDPSAQLPSSLRMMFNKIYVKVIQQCILLEFWIVCWLRVSSNNMGRSVERGKIID